MPFGELTLAFYPPLGKVEEILFSLHDGARKRLCRDAVAAIMALAEKDVIEGFLDFKHIQVAAREQISMKRFFLFARSE